MIDAAFRCSIGMVTLILVCSRCGADDFKDQLPRVEPLSPEQALKQIAVVDGFQVELVANEPMVTSPVAIEWDAEGSLFVCEMRGYSEDRELNISRIVKLIDRDGDGKYEHRTVFAKGLKWPTAIFPYKGGLFVGDAPNLYYFSDQDRDGVAESRRITISGFGLHNVQGLMNSMRWGLDNRIHMACSSVGGELRVPGRDGPPLKVRKGDISFDPETFQLRVESGGAQHGMSFDDWGQKFMSSNSDHLQQVTLERRYLKSNQKLANVSTKMSIAADGPQAPVFRISPIEPWRVVRTRLRVSGLASGPIEGGGTPAGYFTGATGAFVYRGDALPSLRGLVFVGDVGSNLVHRKRLDLSGGKYIGSRIDEGREFIASKDIWFRPAQFASGPDGCLTIVDVCREVIEHPKSLPPSIKQHIDLTAGREKGRIWRVVNGSAAVRNANLKALESVELVDQLGHRNAWHRETAARLLYERKDLNVVTLLRDFFIGSSSELGRLHALYSLKALGALSSKEILLGLQDPQSQVRKHCLILAETLEDKGTVAERCESLASDESLLVRVQLACSLPYLSVADRSKILLQICEKDSGHQLARQAILLASSRIEAKLIDGLLDLADGSSPRISTGQMTLLKQLLSQIDQQKPETTLALVERLRTSGLNDALQSLELLRAMGSLDASQLNKQQAKWIEALEETASQTAFSLHEHERQRVTAFRLMHSKTAEELDSEAVDSLLTIDTSPSVQQAFIEFLDRSKARNLTDIVSTNWSQMLPDVRRVAMDACLRNSERIAKLVADVELGKIPVRDIGRGRWLAAMEVVDSNLRKRIAALGVTSVSSDRETVSKRYRTSLEGGDSERGKKVFNQHCAACHRLGTEGFEVGPSLAAIKTRGAPFILSNILIPNAEVNPEYMNYVVLRKGGQAASGMIETENSNSISLLKDGGRKQTVGRQEIEEVRNSGVSLMPEGFEESISPSQMADLIEYLMTFTVE